MAALRQGERRPRLVPLFPVESDGNRRRSTGSRRDSAPVPTRRGLGHRLAVEREKAGLSQGSLAHRLGVRQQTVSRWEQDAVLPPPSRVMALEDILGLGRGTLLRRAGYVPDGATSPAPAPLASLLASLRDLDEGELVALIDAAWDLLRTRLMNPARRNGRVKVARRTPGPS